MAFYTTVFRNFFTFLKANFMLITDLHINFTFKAIIKFLTFLLYKHSDTRTPITQQPCMANTIERATIISSIRVCQHHHVHVTPAPCVQAMRVFVLCLTVRVCR